MAAHAGVGAGTVSRVLNDSGHVSPATRARVLDAIEALHYRPNPLARGLSRGRGQTIGVIVPFFTQASAIERLRGVVAALDGSPYDLVLFDVESPTHRAEHMATLTRQRADGLLVMTLPVRADDLHRLADTGMAIVLVDSSHDGFPAVVTDDVAGGRMAAEHLLALGHRDIGFIGDAPDNPFGFTSSAQRELGFRQAHDDAERVVREDLVHHGAHQRDVGYALAGRMLAGDEPPTAIVCCSDMQAVGAMEAARDTGLSVPDDVSVVGFDDIELAAHVGLTTVRQPLYRSGELGARLLLEALGAHPPEPGVHELDLELVTRTSTAPPGVRR
ncbi:LacI family DNA-binding transcriptional regulator [Actinomarinicola tropica]|uniref:LacI family DNA-binding transcriptional regulator n=1 Tax=Actinomarinicola tropica TaxID=2789776 RepID=UPI001E56CA8A|nr:LacI family DNA-binding transcriptional regulator [Actinomarinicola tropica]